MGSRATPTAGALVPVAGSFSSSLSLPPLCRTAAANALKLGMGTELAWSTAWAERANEEGAAWLATVEPTCYFDGRVGGATVAERWEPLRSERGLKLWHGERQQGLPSTSRHEYQTASGSSYRGKTTIQSARFSTTQRPALRGERLRTTAKTARVPDGAAPTVPPYRARKPRKARATVEKANDAPYWWPSSLPGPTVDEAGVQMDPVWRSDALWTELYSTRHRKPFCAFLSTQQLLLSLPCPHH
jgi:hypothetical protein